ncbi:Hypothetical_protein [Hexamita inflata]|uniref:Hypothetical_protein n=1 Tax=Hexamita inflata TaxID=28002 RepID=A0AA86NI22_9EUKA|nr:Hypothetical protein HINF_LOCUS8004 [Hexamita inflata]CAI9920362.1 Hypothetical protein HINF_LOCUS8007 [Hexamita inflata]CAI9966683.1 Hypothetical protein HINF_LOCUS54328 [Hexamita inflata]
MYVRRTSAAKATNDSGTRLQGRNAAASCKQIYTGIHLRRTICNSKEAMERLPLSNPESSLMACPQPYRSLMMPAQHFESGDFTFRNRFGRAASQKVGRGEEREAQPNEPIIDHTKQSRYSSNASSALTSNTEPNRSLLQCFNNILILMVFFTRNSPTQHAFNKNISKTNSISHARNLVREECCWFLIDHWLERKCDDQRKIIIYPTENSVDDYEYVKRFIFSLQQFINNTVYKYNYNAIDSILFTISNITQNQQISLQQKGFLQTIFVRARSFL